MNDVRIPGSFLFRGLFPALILSSALLLGLYFSMSVWVEGDGLFLGYPTSFWVWILGGCILFHQFLVWLVWRTQLCFQLFSRVFGDGDLVIWGILFLPLLAARPVFSLFIGLSDFGSLPGSEYLYLGLGILLLLLSLLGGFSVIRYFGIGRALGGDHFKEKYRKMPLERRGMFRISSNVMYTYVFLLFWAIGFLTRSRAAIIAALFQHAMIWVHMFTLEAPDMEVIYKNNAP